MLGASGSGKTVFLASMFNKLLVQNEDIGFYLTVPSVEQRKLNAKFSEIEDGREWPQGTLMAENSTWEFTCTIKNGNNGKVFSPLKFRYFDYAGGRITDPNLTPDEIALFDQRATNAHALLGILDGHKIYALMTHSEPPIGTSFSTDLRNILPIMQKTENPVHFVLTKWDLFEGEFSLKDVVNYLLTHYPIFKNFNKKPFKANYTYAANSC
jgi:hypothetical protein